MFISYYLICKLDLKNPNKNIALVSLSLHLEKC